MVHDCSRLPPLEDPVTRQARPRRESTVAPARIATSALTRPRVSARCAESAVAARPRTPRARMTMATISSTKLTRDEVFTSRATNEVGKWGRVEKRRCSELLWQCARAVQVPADLLEAVPRDLVEQGAEAHSQTRRRLAAISPRCQEGLGDGGPLRGIERLAEGGGNRDCPGSTVGTSRGKSAGSRISWSDSTPARSMVCSSSRAFPGHD